MPYRIPMAVPSVSQDEIAARVWAYTTRILSNLSDARAAKIDNLDGTLSSRLSTSGFNAVLPAARAAYIDDIELQELEQAYASDEVQTTLNTTGSDQSLGSKNITVAMPVGATRMKAFAMALILVNNKTDTEQSIDFNLKVAGSTIFSQDAVIGFSAAKGSQVVPLIQDCTTQVTGDGTFAVEAEAKISAAQNVAFTVVYFIFVQYRMLGA